MQRYPIAYIRRSSADASDPGDVSREAQEAAVRELARREGHNGNLRIYDDWNRSADVAKEAKRTGLNALLADIEAGKVSAVYAYALDRVYRSMRTFVRLTDAAKAHDVRIVTLREGVLGGDGSPMAQAFAQITAVFSELELNTTKARAAGAMAVRRQRGDHIGRVGYGYKLARNEAGAIVAVPDPDRPLEPLFQAMRDGGNILAACKLLNERGVPVPSGPTAERRHHAEPIWHPTPLRKIIARNAPELLPRKGPTGRRQSARSSALAQLLVCHCGHVLTPEPGRGSYRCTRGNRSGSDVHGKMFVTERAILPWIKDEAARFDPHKVGTETTLSEPDDVRRGTIIEQRRKLALAFTRGALDDATYEAEDAALASEMSALDAMGEVYGIPSAIDWTWSPERLNAVLRTYWNQVELGPDMRPIRADWRLPEEWLR
ncbi:MAG: recombinase family protein [Chloroflexi bacterium]|nr:recombinase family protein [Chloroflexota bacterium]